jgi:hypothetical protein
MKIAKQKSYSHLKRKLPFLGFFQIPQNANKFYNTPARLTFWGGRCNLVPKLVAETYWNLEKG